ncbi:hypothetical protein [Bartonella sp. ML70XJBT.G]|nr:hypothetical protein [Bartonella sp. ML70XJBT.G]
MNTKADMVMATTWYMLTQQARMPALGLEIMLEKWCAFRSIKKFTVRKAF